MNIIDEKGFIKGIFNAAIKIEEEGIDFYTDLENNTDDRELKRLFKSLARDEKRHKKTFQNMLKNLNIDKDEKAKNEEFFMETDNNVEEYLNFLADFTHRDIFTSERVKKTSEGLENLKDAIMFAIRRELDSILFYQEIKDFYNSINQTTNE